MKPLERILDLSRGFCLKREERGSTFHFLSRFLTEIVIIKSPNRLLVNTTFSLKYSHDPHIFSMPFMPGEEGM